MRATNNFDVICPFIAYRGKLQFEKGTVCAIIALLNKHQLLWVNHHSGSFAHALERRK